MSEVMILIPKHILQRASVLLETAADSGIDARYEDGKATENAKVARETAIEIGKYCRQSPAKVI